MSETDEAPQEAPEEPDTDAEQVRMTFPELVLRASDLAHLARRRKELEKEEETLRLQILRDFEQMPNLHGIRLPNGDAVRKSWSVRTTAKPEPARLRELMADADEYIREVVDLPALRKDYPSVWERAGKVKRAQTLTIRLAGEK